MYLRSGNRDRSYSDRRTVRLPTVRVRVRVSEARSVRLTISSQDVDGYSDNRVRALYAHYSDLHIFNRFNSLHDTTLGGVPLVEYYASTGREHVHINAKVAGIRPVGDPNDMKRGPPSYTGGVPTVNEG